LRHVTIDDDGDPIRRRPLRVRRARRNAAHPFKLEEQ
jgi:hypothetical protein